MKKSIIISILAMVSLGVCAQTNSAIIPYAFDDAYTSLGAVVAKVKVRVENNGSAAIKNLGYKTLDLTGESAEKTVKLDTALEPGSSALVEMKFTPGKEVGKSTQTVVITKVNGKANEALESSAKTSGTIYTYPRQLPRKTVEEECTGDWCGYCPRGMVGMEKLTEMYPESFIGIAYHFKDNMYIAENEAVRPSGYPFGKLNRKALSDVYSGSTGRALGIEDDFLREQDIYPDASLTLDAWWADEAMSKVNLAVDMEFVWPNEHGMALAFVVTQDALMTGSQANYYGGDSKYADDPYMKEFYNGGSYVTVVFNHVAVAAVGLASGIPGSVSSPVAVGERQSFEYQIDLSTASLINNKSKLSVVAMLLDTYTGSVLNADKVSIGKTSGLTEMGNDKSIVGNSFNLAGQRVDGSVKGITIRNGKKIIR